MADISIIHGVALYANQDMVVKSFNDNESSFEDESIKFWISHLDPDKVAVDIGAYTGLYSLVAAKRGCCVDAYEPNPVVFDRLRENINLNATIGAPTRSLISPYREAISDRGGLIDFWVKPGTYLTSASSLIEGPDYIRITTPVKTLNTLSPVSVIKIDVEGAELSVLKGAKEILERDKPAVIAEALSPQLQADLIDFMSNLGYGYSILDSRNLGFVIL